MASKQFAKTVIATQNYQNCTTTSCKKELEAVDKVVHKLNQKSTKLYVELEANKISRSVYDKKMREIKNTLSKTKESIDRAKCDLKHCEKQARAFLKTFVEDAEKSCETKEKCKIIKKDKSALQTKMSLQAYKKLKNTYV